MFLWSTVIDDKEWRDYAISVVRKCTDIRTGGGERKINNTSTNADMKRRTIFSSFITFEKKGRIRTIIIHITYDTVILQFCLLIHWSLQFLLYKVLCWCNYLFFSVVYFVLRSVKKVFVFDQQGLYFLLKLSYNWERHVRITTIHHKILLINVLIDSGTTRRLHFKSFPAISIFNIIHYYVHLVLL